MYGRITKFTKFSSHLHAHTVVSPVIHTSYMYNIINKKEKRKRQEGPPLDRMYMAGMFLYRFVPHDVTF